MAAFSSSSARPCHQTPSLFTPTNTVGPLPFAPTLESRPAPAPTFLPSSRLTTPLAAPPPPLNLAPNPASTNMGRKVPYAGAEHTLGPTFSEEEDGDDSEWIASKMAVLGLDPSGVPYSGRLAAKENVRRDPRHLGHAHYDHARQASHAQEERSWEQQLPKPPHVTHQQFGGRSTHLEQIQQQQYNQLMIQQQQLAHLHMMAQQPGQSGQPYREALATLHIQAQQAALQSDALHNGHAHRAILSSQLRHAQPLSYDELTRPSHSASEQRSAIAARVQANLLARTGRNKMVQMDEQDLRARFESVPNTHPTYSTPASTQPVFEPIRSPFGEWRSSTRHAAFEEFKRQSAQTSRFVTAQGDSLSTFLSRRRATDESSTSSESEGASFSTEATLNQSKNDTAQTSPNPSLHDGEKVSAQIALGFGRPAHLAPSDRASTAPIQRGVVTNVSAATRAASYAAPATRAVVTRQPYGPPGEAKDLGDKNFASRLRRQAGLNLGMLGRRTETPLSTPSLS